MLCRIKKILTAFICLLFVSVTGFSLKTYAAGNLPSDLFVEYHHSKTNFSYQTRLWRGVADDGLDMEASPVVVKSHIVNPEKYYLSLPADAKANSICITFPEGMDIRLDGKAINSGEEIAHLEEGVHTIVCNGEENSLEVIYLSEIPTVYITTDNYAMDAINVYKRVDAGGHIRIVNGDKTEYDGPLERIEGRGNSTWYNVKKPYNIKLATKANILGMGSAKKYALLADYYDATRLRNRLAYNLAGYVGIEYALDAYNVNLYIDNQYFGVYTLTEKVEINDNRIDIFNTEELNEKLNAGVVFEECKTASESFVGDSGAKGKCYWTELPNQESVADGGYLLELDFSSKKGYKPAGFVSAYGQAVVVRSPQYITREQSQYISDFYQQMEDALLSDDGYNSQGRHYSEYIDVESFAKMYVYQEYVKNLDSSLSSFYLYKDMGGKFHAAPVWDMDSSLGKENVIEGENLADPQGIWAADAVDYTRTEKYSLLALCCKHNDFKRQAAEQWNRYFAPSMDKLCKDAQYLSEHMCSSVKADMAHYPARQYTKPENIDSAYEYEQQRLKDFISGRAEFLGDYFGGEKYYVQYCSKGGHGVVTDAQAYHGTDTATVKENQYINGESAFIGWNTKADGSGDWYYPGDSLQMSEKDVYLFAQWDKDAGDYIYRKPPAQNRTLLEIMVEFLDKII